jgi:hypothetical protein
MAKYDDWDADYNYKPRKKEPEIVYVNKPIYKNAWFWISISLCLAIVILLTVLLPPYIKLKQLEKEFAKLQEAADEWNSMVDDLNSQIADFNAKQQKPVQEEPQAIEANTETQEEPAPVEEAIEPEPEYRIGEKWIVDGQWELQITGVTETEERNTYSDKNPSAVYIVDYTYTNLGYVDETGYWQGLYLSITDSIVDNANLMGYDYDVDSIIGHSPQETPVGASCQAKTSIGVDNSGSFKLYIMKRDGNNEKRTATFLMDVP